MEKGKTKPALHAIHLYEYQGPQNKKLQSRKKYGRILNKPE